jgi:redox-sensing transcriptional repressor
LNPVAHGSRSHSVRDLSSRISDSTVRRLSAYYRVLGEMIDEGLQTVSSYDVAQRSGVTSAQIRKDLSFFGHFGKRGTGYRVTPLRDEIKAILGLNRKWRVVVVGAGNLAHALFSYREFRRQGFEIVGIFDNNESVVGQEWDGVRVDHISNFQQQARELKFEMGVITTPASAAQEVAELMVQAGIEGILNFAPRKLSVPETISLRNVNMAIELESLSFALK